jgi:hypothetical protein
MHKDVMLHNKSIPQESLFPSSSQYALDHCPLSSILRSPLVFDTHQQDGLPHDNAHPNTSNTHANATATPCQAQRTVSAVCAARSLDRGGEEYVSSL